ncbi:MAG: histidine--tRNA ligase [Propylenella sp.]
MPDKKNRLEPRLPRGFADRGPEDIRAVERMMEKIKRVYERYGFEPVETPFVEYTEALGKFLPDQDRPGEGVFSFQDEDGQEARSAEGATGKPGAWLSLRYDLTAPLARYVAENFERLPKPYRSYRAGWVFRNEKPGPGRYRQFMQFDADTVGSSSPAADAEICMMAADAMEELGFERGQYVIKVNSRKVLDGVMEAIGVVDERQKLTVLRAIDKLDRLGLGGVRQLLGEGRKDESGDFTKGAGLARNKADRVLGLVSWWSAGKKRVYNPPSDSVVVASVRAFASDDAGRDVVIEYPDNIQICRVMTERFAENELAFQGIDELAEISTIAKAAGYEGDRILVDTSVVRGLEYYTGPVFEAQLTFEVPNERGEPVVFGSVGGGGRYDGLVGRFRGEDVPATGFSVGVSRLAAALKAVGKLGDEAAPGPIVVTVMDRARMTDYQRIVADLRNAGVAAEMYLGASGMKAQLKYADRRNASAAIIAGSQEFESGKLQIKDLAAGKAGAAAIASHADYKEERPGQFEVAASDIVAEVKKLLTRQKGG